MIYQIIEHPTRGVLIGHDVLEQKHRFSWTILRTDQKAMAFYSLHSLQAMIETMPWKLRAACYVLTITSVNGHRRVAQQPSGVSRSEPCRAQR